MKKKDFILTHRLIVLLSDIENWPLESCGQDIWLSRTVKCARMNLVGLPAKRLDVIIDRALVDNELSGDEPIVCEIGRKIGKYDNRERIRICFREYGPRLANDPTYTKTEGRIRVSAVESDYMLEATDIKYNVLWQETLPRLRAYANPGAAGEILMWHWSRYFRHLPADEIEDIASHFKLPEGLSITAANRMASNLLYSESRGRGWSKLTVRERERLGLDGGPWIRTDVVAIRRAERMGCDPSGTGEYTRDAAKPLQASIADFAKERIFR